MITLKSGEEIIRMRDAGRIAAIAREIGGEHVREGVTTAQIDREIKKCILSHGAKPSFLGYGGFPASACISVNEEIIHGIPSSDKVLKNGDIVKIDVGAYYKGYHGDTAATVGVGSVSAEAQQLMDVTARCLELGIAQAIRGNRIGDISHAVYEVATKAGYGVVYEYCGHGVGLGVHEDPSVPNVPSRGPNPRIQPGMVLAIEPMINVGTDDVLLEDDDWTVITADGSLSAHEEHTVAVFADHTEILTRMD